MAKIPPGVGPKFPHVVVLFGATGDLSRRKLLPGMFHLSNSGFIPGYRIIGVSLEDMTPESFREFVRAALREFSSRKVTDEAWSVFAANLTYVPQAAGAGALRAAVENAEKSLTGETRPARLCRPCACWGRPDLSNAPESSWKSLSASISRAPCP